jgi:uncharacterized protein (TIGR02145 family)
MKIKIVLIMFLGVFNFNHSQTVTIGTQVWMTKNLNVEKFANGDDITEVKTQEEWEKAIQEERPAWCYFNNNPRKGKKYGKIYNWYAVIDSRGLAEEGWRIPNDEDWKILTETLSKDERQGTTDKGSTKKIDYPQTQRAKVVFSNSFVSIKSTGFRKRMCIWWSLSEHKTYSMRSTSNFKNGNVYRLADNGLGAYTIRCIKD